MRSVDNGLEKEFDTYIKKTIIHTTIKFAKDEIQKKQNEVSFEMLQDVIDNNYNEPKYYNNIEDLFENEKLSSIIAKLPIEKKTILKLSIVDKYNSKEIASIVGKSDSRIRHIINDTLKEIREKYKK